MTSAIATGTLEGILAFENAEILSGIIILRLINKKVPVCYWGIQHIMDMQTGNISFGSPEKLLMGLASIQKIHKNLLLVSSSIKQVFTRTFTL